MNHPLGFFTMNKKLHSCPMPLAFGESGIGKTTALESANKRDISEAECLKKANKCGPHQDEGIRLLCNNMQRESQTPRGLKINYYASYLTDVKEQLATT